MSRYGRDRSNTKSRSKTPRPLSSRIVQDDESDEHHQLFKGPDGNSKPVFDIKELKKITVNIIRKAPQKKIPELQKVPFDPSTVAPVRRKDEGKRPIFERKELLEWSKTQNVKLEGKIESPPPTKNKDKIISSNDSPSSDERTRRKERSPRKHDTSPPHSVTKIRYKEKDEIAPTKCLNERFSRSETTISRIKDDQDSKHKSERRYVEKYVKERESSSERRRRSRYRSRSPHRESRRGRSYGSRSRSRSRSRSYSYDGRSRSRSYERRRSHSRDRRGHHHYDPVAFIEEREYLKMLRRKQKERDDKRLKEDSMRMQLEKKDREEKENPKTEPKTTADGSTPTGGEVTRPRPPRMRPMFRPPPMVPMMPYMPMYPPMPPRFRPPFRPPFPPYPHPQRFYPPY